MSAYNRTTTGHIPDNYRTTIEAAPMHHRCTSEAAPMHQRYVLAGEALQAAAESYGDLTGMEGLKV